MILLVVSELPNRLLGSKFAGAFGEFIMSFTSPIFVEAAELLLQTLTCIIDSFSKTLTETLSIDLFAAATDVFKGLTM